MKTRTLAILAPLMVLINIAVFGGGLAAIAIAARWAITGDWPL